MLDYICLFLLDFWVIGFVAVFIDFRHKQFLNLNALVLEVAVSAIRLSP